MTDKWLTIDQIARYLQVSKEKIYKLCQRGSPGEDFQIPPGSRWRIGDNGKMFTRRRLVAGPLRSSAANGVSKNKP